MVGNPEPSGSNMDTNKDRGGNQKSGQPALPRLKGKKKVPNYPKGIFRLILESTTSRTFVGPISTVYWFKNSEH